MIAEGDAVERALIASMHAAFGDVYAYVRSGDPARIDRALGLIDTCYRIASEAPFLQRNSLPGVAARGHGDAARTARQLALDAAR